MMKLYFLVLLLGTIAAYSHLPAAMRGGKMNSRAR